MVIIGEKKMLQFDEMDPKNKIKIYNKYATYPDVKIFKKEFFTPKANIYMGKTFSPKIKFKSPMKEELLHFFNSISQKTETKTSANFALDVMRILEKIEKKIN